MTIDWIFQMLELILLALIAVMLYAGVNYLGLILDVLAFQNELIDKEDALDDEVDMEKKVMDAN